MRTKAGRVSEGERRLARLQDQDRGRLDRLGVQASLLIGGRAQRAAYQALKRGDSPAKAAAAEFEAAVPLITKTMIAGHLAGRKRSAMLAAASPKLALKNTPLDYALQYLAQRLALDEFELTQLESLYHATAVRVVKAASMEVEKKIESKLFDLLATGAHVREGKKALAEAFEAAGIVPNNSFTLEAIFRTQTQLAYGAGRWNADQSPAIQEILWGYKYVTVGDDRVRPEHVGFEGVTLPKDDAFWQTNWPPNGWACRCCAISVFEPRSPVYPPDHVEVDGKLVKPAADPGFQYHPGLMFADGLL
jgi:SPP1 gp7 family putative phage head morphogenesis protein